jgi:AcrR family transcriptional regulator
MMSKGKETKQKILDIGLDMASRLGLDSVSIGALAKATRMSKSGLFAHFQSKENLQHDILRYAGDLFTDLVIAPTLKTEAGIPRIKALVENWDRWAVQTMTGGCVFVQAGNDFKNRDGKVRDYLLIQQESWIDCLQRIARSAIRAGHFREGIDCNQFAFEFYSLLLGFHLYFKLLKDEDTRSRQDEALAGLILRYRR